MKISWLQKNKWGLILVVPALVLALGASSFRLVTIYLPWSAEYGTHVEGEVVIPSERVGVELPGNQKFEAHLTMLSLTPVTSVADPNSYSDAELTAAPGARLWRLNTVVRADPQMVLVDCKLSLEDEAGNHYTATPGKLSDGLPALGGWDDLCVPTGASGPSADLLNEYVPADPENERPERYRVETYFALPESVTPSRVRVSIAQGKYWTIDAPVR